MTLRQDSRAASASILEARTVVIGGADAAVLRMLTAGSCRHLNTAASDLLKDSSFAYVIWSTRSGRVDDVCVVAGEG